MLDAVFEPGERRIKGTAEATIVSVLEFSDRYCRYELSRATIRQGLTLAERAECKS
jgi:hypothetical protein